MRYRPRSVRRRPEHGPVNIGCYSSGGHGTLFVAALASSRSARSGRWHLAQGRLVTAATPGQDALTNLSLDAGSAYANSVTACRQQGNALAGMLATDTAVLLPDDFLVKVDRASMAHGLEVRPPLLDHELLELTARIPSHLKIRAGQTKWLFKEAFRAELPPDVTKRPKQGFDIPVDDWLRGPLRPMFESTVLGSSSAMAGLIDRETAKVLYRNHLVGSGRHGAILWSLLVLARWAERYSPDV